MFLKISQGRNDKIAQLMGKDYAPGTIERYHYIMLYLPLTYPKRCLLFFLMPPRFMICHIQAGFETIPF